MQVMVKGGKWEHWLVFILCGTLAAHGMEEQRVNL
jgi:hypothetical protein